jgi:leucyl-tRNA synthetase
MRGVEGVSRFLARVWRLLMTENQAGAWELSGAIQETEPYKAQQKITHATIKKVSDDIETLSFNTAISQMMIFVNAFTNAESIPLTSMRAFLIILNPFAPHLTSELWERLNEKFSGVGGDITAQSWPAHDEKFLIEDEVEMVVQINGKVRDRMTLPLNATEEAVKAAVLANARIQALIAGKTIRKIIVIPNKLVNIVL